MTVYELTTNEGRFFVRRWPTSHEMLAYIKAKRALGKTLASILFCWGPVNLIDRAPKAPARI